MTDLEMLIMALLAVAGAITSAALGWADSGEPFNARKFVSSIGRAIVAGILVAVTGVIAPTADVTMMNYLLAFLAGSGIDVLGNRVAGSILGK